MSESHIEKIHEAEGSKTRLADLFFRYAAYIPLILICVTFGLLGAYLKLRYSHSSFVVKSRIVINLIDDNSDKKDGIKISLGTEGNSSLDKETEVIRSQESMYQVVKNLGLYTELTKKGRVIVSPMYGPELPIKITLANPNSIVSEKTYPLSFDYEHRRISLAGVFYPVSKFVQTPFGLASFEFVPQIVVAIKDRIFLHVTPPINLARRLSASIAIIPKSKDSPIFDISYKDEIPERAVSILSNMINVYDSITVQRQKDKSRNIEMFIDERLRIIADELTGVEKELEDYKSQKDIVDLKSEGSAFFEKIQAARKEYDVLQLQIKVLDQIAESINKRNLSKSTIPSIVELNNTNLTALLLSLYQTETELDKEQKLSGPSNPQVVYLQEHLDKMRPGIIASVQNLRKTYLLSLQNYQNQIDQYENMLKAVPEKERHVLDITRRQEVKNAIYTFLLQKREESALTAAAATPQTQILEKPENVGLISPIASSTYTLFGMVGLGISLFIIWLAELLNNTIKEKSDLERFTGVPIVGDLNHVDMPDDETQIVIGKNIQTVISEQFRNLRTNLTYLGLREQNKVLLVTSSVGREGKSFVALNTAIGLSLTGKRVLLMDFDLRKPKITTALSNLTAKGITNYLIGTAPFADIVQDIRRYENLYFVSSGIIPPNPTELIVNERMKTLIEEARRDFDFIVFDTPPIGAVTDAKLISEFSDVSLYVVRQNYTPKFFLNMIADFPSSKVFNHLGLVFNGIKTKSVFGYTDQYKYGYGYGYASDDQPIGQAFNWLKFKFRK